MPQGILIQQHASNKLTTHRLNFGTDQTPIKYYIYKSALDDEIVVSLVKTPLLSLLAILRALLLSHLRDLRPDLFLETQTWSISLHPRTEVHVSAPGWGWDPLQDPGTGMLPGSSVGADSLVLLRPDDVVRIGEIVLQIKQDSSMLASELNDVQVKSSGHTRATVDMENGDQENRREAVDLPSNVIHTLCTPDLQLDGTTMKMETIMETPAAPRHHDVVAKASPVLPSIDENTIHGGDDGQERKDIVSRDRLVARSPDEPTLLDGSLVQPPQVQDNDNRSNNVPFDPTETIIESETKLIEDSFVQLDHTNEQSNEDSQMSSCIRADQSHQTIESQERLSDLPPKSPTSQRHIEEPNTLEAAADISIQLSSELKQLDSYPVLESSSRGHKRKRLSEESTHDARSTFHVEIPTKQPVMASKTPNRRRKTNPALVSSSSMLALTRESTLTSPRGSAELSPSVRSTRSSVFDTATPQPSARTGLKILFASSTSIDKKTRTMKFLASHGGQKATSVADCDVLCVGKGDLKKTSNLVLAVLHGKEIVTDDWVLHSASKGELLDVHDYLARDPVKEAEWGANLSEAIQRGNENVKPLLGRVFRFTTAAQQDLGKGFSELKEIALLAGAKSVLVGIPRSSTVEDMRATVYIVAPNDPEVRRIEQAGWKCFSKDIITLSVLRGALDATSDEFVIRAISGESPSPATGNKKRRK